MMNQEANHGITYSLSFLRNADYSKVLFWLGIKPLDFDDLHELLTNISDNQLITIIEELQTKYLISPIKEAGCFVLPDSSMDQIELLKYRNTVEQYI
ncbi:hypothetical protein [Limosilactobacillus reuteri]|uniref:hypothetical protein n=1 Tax=Limosilactobacillus reuteri TaxID=1598 RepID=UPI00177D62E2|nr:hypothetical protein [Limosilactobacillus reuteri]